MWSLFVNYFARMCALFGLRNKQRGFPGKIYTWFEMYVLSYSLIHLFWLQSANSAWNSLGAFIVQVCESIDFRKEVENKTKLVVSFSDTLRESKSENSLHSKNRGTRQKVAPKYILQNVLAIIVSSKMCLIECVFIVDEREELIFEYTVKPSSPTYSYVHKQLLRVAAGNSHIKTSDFSSSQNVQCFSPDAIMDSVLEIDSKWRVAWNMVDKVYLIAVGRIEEKYVDVYSDEEDDEEDTVSEEDNKAKGL